MPESLNASLGYQIRVTHRALQNPLKATISPFGVSLGMWYFLRVLWEEDGLTRRELSNRVGTMEPTTLTALRSMEKKNLIIRKRNAFDGRKINVFLSDKGRNLRDVLLPKANRILERAVRGFSEKDREMLHRALVQVRENLGRA
jgi:MarR family transcriptional regulator, organic hydroperoxide resistance regulator